MPLRLVVGQGRRRKQWGERVQQHIVGVHGIKQGRTSQRELIKDWNKALNRGITALHGQDAVRTDPRLTPTLEIPHWSSLLARGAERRARRTSSRTTPLPSPPTKKPSSSRHWTIS
ncbi:hypothetical protein [Streptomyces mirabilis]|uniref:hypothetical protein n=1 Tax=Streptomyces mirabilis TaxID=68239 RepID=UPI003401E7A8